MRASLFLISMLAVAACGSAPGPSAPSNQGGGGGYIIWSRGEGDAVSRWLDADGTERGHATGQYLVRDGKLFRVERKELKIKLGGCDLDGDEGTPPETMGEGSSTELSLVPVAGGGAPLVLEPGLGPDDGADYGELSESSSVRGVLGRFVMVEAGSTSFGCGAHGNGDASAAIYEVGTGARVDEAFAADVVKRLGPAVAKTLSDAEDVDAEPAGEGAEVHVGETLTTWKGGKPGARYLLWIDACYACGNGRWSSYTSGAWVDDDRLPPPFDAEAATVPAPVAAALGKLVAGETADAQIDTGVSWGSPDESWAATFKP